MLWFAQHDLAVALLANTDSVSHALPEAAVALGKVATLQLAAGSESTKK